MVDSKMFYLLVHSEGPDVKFGIRLSRTEGDFGSARVPQKLFAADAYPARLLPVSTALTATHHPWKGWAISW